MVSLTLNLQRLKHNPNLPQIEQIVLFEHASEVLENEIEYSKRGICLCYRIPQLYGSAKIHKMESPTSDILWQPGNSQCGRK